jgi:hypothetical protein
VASITAHRLGPGSRRLGSRSTATASARACGSLGAQARQYAGVVSPLMPPTALATTAYASPEPDDDLWHTIDLIDGKTTTSMAANRLGCLTKAYHMHLGLYTRLATSCCRADAYAVTNPQKHRPGFAPEDVWQCPQEHPMSLGMSEHRHRTDDRPVEPIPAAPQCPRPLDGTVSVSTPAGIATIFRRRRLPRRAPPEWTPHWR